MSESNTNKETSIQTYIQMLKESRNIIFRGAPGTGKTYLARRIAASIVSNGETENYEDLTDEQKKQVGFVQFHPSYDYSDFVEGLRPKTNDDGSIGFELRDGIFTQFAKRAQEAQEAHIDLVKRAKQENYPKESLIQMLSGKDYTLKTEQKKTEFHITKIEDNDQDASIYIGIPLNSTSKTVNLSLNILTELLKSDRKIKQVKDVTDFLVDMGIQIQRQQRDSYYFSLIKDLEEEFDNPEKTPAYVFIIDEINRGEISKIFGELFFSMDPEYRGRKGEVFTQYANMHDKPEEKFFIPENVYIIGTMNDIDRSVDSFDFAMRRRFRFIEIRADERQEMLASLGDKKKVEAIRRMNDLNKEIVNTEDLNENYQVGPAYFLKLQTVDFDQLWTDYLQPLLEEYVRGMHDETKIMEGFAKAYGYKGISNESAQN